MHKRIFIVLSILFTAVKGEVYVPENFKLGQPLTSATTEIKWDVDGVLATRNGLKEVIKKAGKAFVLLVRMSRTIGITETFNFAKWNYQHRKEYKKITHNKHDIAFIDYAAHNNPKLHSSLSDGRSITDHWKDIFSDGHALAGMNVLVDLYNHNYQMGIATNQSRYTFDHLIKTGKMPSHDHFSQIQTGDSSCNNENICVKKPQDHYYEQLKEYDHSFGDSLSKNVVFIDDDKNNVLAAVKNGLIGIHHRPNDEHQLRQDLKKLGINL